MNLHGFSHGTTVVMNPRRPGRFLLIEKVEWPGRTAYMKFEGEIPEGWDGSLVRGVKATVIAQVSWKPPRSGSGMSSFSRTRKLMAMIPQAEWREIEAGMVMQEPTPSNAFARDHRSGKSFSFVFRIRHTVQHPAPAP